jgi:molecular chaperone GrpE (heat shock protein)
MLQSSDGNSATASLLMEFLPVWDKLTALRILHSEDDFGKQYNALPGAIISSFNAMGVVDFAVDAGVAVDLRRVRVVETQASDDVAADTVLRAVAGGLELDGNVIRKAEVVASSGPVVVADAADADATEDEASQEEASE